MECDGKYPTFGTGRGGLISGRWMDLEQWCSETGGGAAPDAMKIGDRYLVVYGATGGRPGRRTQRQDTYNVE